jgi:1,6-anhydro-N-acetylmuramate kinase
MMKKQAKQLLDALTARPVSDELVNDEAAMIEIITRHLERADTERLKNAKHELETQITALVNAFWKESGYCRLHVDVRVIEHSQTNTQVKTFSATTKVTIEL